MVVGIRVRHTKKLKKTNINFNIPHQNSKLFLIKNPNNLIMIKVIKMMLIITVITTTIIMVIIIIIIIIIIVIIIMIK